MNVGNWEPTMYLRWSKDGKLQQAWYCKTVEYRMYGGVERRCEGSNSEWRDVPTETVGGER
jgi:hypothetical protein